MGLLDRLFGRRRAHYGYDTGSGQDTGAGYHAGAGYGDQGYAQGYGSQAPPVPAGSAGGQGRLSDQQAVERYRYLLRTAPPDQIEEAHAEAFAQLTPDQRQQVLVQLAAAVPSGERPHSDDPRNLARAATRAELRQPGTLERAFGGGYGPGYGGRGPGFGSMMGASLLGTIGGLVVGTAVADALFDGGPGDGGLFGGGDEAASADGADPGGEYGGDPGGDFAGGADGGWGGDFGGGDFGGGDF